MINNLQIYPLFCRTGLLTKIFQIPSSPNNTILHSPTTTSHVFKITTSFARLAFPCTKMTNFKHRVLREKSANKLRGPISLFQTLQFPEAFLTAPTIIVSAAHTKTLLAMPPEYNSIVTWVEVIISQTADLYSILVLPSS